MSKLSTTTLKSFFETDDIPTQSNFESLIDSLENLDSKSWDIKTDGTTDSSTELQFLFDSANNGDTVFLPKGIIYLSTAVSITKELKIIGQGTVVKINSAIKAFILNADNTSIKNVDFLGSGGKTANQYGVFVNSKNNFKINNCSFESLYHGISFESTILSGAYVVSDISVCFFKSNTYGIKGGVRGEYVNIIGCTGFSNTNHIEFKGGNISVSSCTFTGGVNGIRVLSGSNDSHGIISACQINHCTGTSILFDGITHGHTVTGLHAYQGSIHLKDCSGVSFNNCLLDVNSFLFENATGSVFSQNRHDSAYLNNVDKSYNSAPTSIVISSENYLLNGTAYTSI